MRGPRAALHPSPLPVALRRSAADAGLLTVTGALLALAAALAVVVPTGLERAADRAVAAAVRADPGRSAVVLQVPLGDSASELGITADLLTGVARAQAVAVGREVPGVLGEPVGSVEVTRLSTVLAEGEQGLTSLRLVHVWRGGAPAVTWTSGGPAGPAPEPGADDAPVPVSVGLSGPVAQALGAGTGDRVPALLGGSGGSPVDVVVSGVFTPVDAADPAWAATPGLLAPQVSGTGATAATDVAALVDDAQVPALVAVPAGQPVITTTLPALPAALGASGVEATAAALAALEAAPPSQLPGAAGAPARLRTDLDDVLRSAGADVSAARARASVLLAALVAGAAALVVLAASLLAARRAAALQVLRTRGAPLLATAVESGVEAAVVAAAAVGAGVGVAAALGAHPLGAHPLSAHSLSAAPLVLVPLLLLAVAAPARLAVLRASAADAPARSAATRAPGGRTRGSGSVRGLATDAAVVLLAALALAALTAPGSPPGSPSDPSTGPLAAAALPLGALAAALLARRALQPLLAPLRSRAVRRGSAVSLVAAARLEAAARRTPVLVALVLTAAGATAAALLAAGPGASDASSAAAAVLGSELRRLAVVVAVALALLAALAVVLDAVATAPQRRTEASAAAVLGVPRAAQRVVAVAELVPLAAVGTVLGAVAGALLAAVTAGARLP